MIRIKKPSATGFALLITLLTAGVIISAILSIVELSRLQLKLSVDSKDAEVAFSASNAAKECAQYIRTVKASDIKTGNTFTANCFEKAFTVSKVNPLGFGTSGVSGQNKVWRYKLEVTWGEDNFERCSIAELITVYAVDNDVTIGGTGNNSLKNLLPNYPNDSMNCITGSECTIIVAAGYNSACNQRQSGNVLKREVLLEF